ncbi:hypothetical protein NKH18_27260 [Streptomyces sp. M10(2022)]
MKHLSGRKQLGALVGTVVLVGAGGWIAGTQVHSPPMPPPRQRAEGRPGDRRGPAAVPHRDRGGERLHRVRLAPAALTGRHRGHRIIRGAAGEGAEQRVTKAPVAGAKIKEGDVLMAVNGRPVLALSGRVPMYRALGPGPPATM